ncbi:hypothetical protein DFJ74DRAFT_36623 [Hyaloraphidium curvatum]|nr:hypothetical protein DFJ74DRAFT_36623 [Hyaloraphidium curvatum]
MPHPPRLHNHSTSSPRVALITGAASPKGIGRAAAKLFAEHGARVVVTDIPSLEAQGRDLVEEIKGAGGEAVWVQLDVTSEEQWDAAVATAEREFGPLDILFNNAGIGLGDGSLPLEEHPTADYNKTVAVNLTGVYLGIKAAARSMKKRDKGVKEAASIVSVSSVAGLSGNCGPFDYTMTKHGVLGATRYAALSLGKHNIRVNCIHPGLTDTNIFDGLEQLPEEEREATRIAFASSNVLKRWASPLEVANVALFLASSESSFVTGTGIVVDGGLMAGAGGPPFGSEP